jgi:hypothetical protein
VKLVLQILGRAKPLDLVGGEPLSFSLRTMHLPFLSLGSVHLESKGMPCLGFIRLALHITTLPVACPSKTLQRGMLGNLEVFTQVKFNYVKLSPRN